MEVRQKQKCSVRSSLSIKNTCRWEKNNFLFMLNISSSCPHYCFFYVEEKERKKKEKNEKRREKFVFKRKLSEKYHS